MGLVYCSLILKFTAMYIVYTYCGIERKLSVHFLPDLMSKNHISLENQRSGLRLWARYRLG
jgi:hypothetical protein